MENGETDFGWQGAVIVAIVFVPPLITLLKGRYLFLALGVLLGVFWIVGAIRLAAPGSFWYVQFYGPEKRARADKRFKKDTDADSPPPAPA